MRRPSTWRRARASSRRRTRSCAACSPEHSGRSSDSGPRLARDGGARRVPDGVRVVVGIDTAKPDASYETPDLQEPNLCNIEPCEWALALAHASTYEFKSFLIDARTQQARGGVGARPGDVDALADPGPATSGSRRAGRAT